ncbi:MAG: DUF4442 domain-containing protein [Chitinophagaceae bacterium]|nr:DUF4442 domain-containing protein [Chitinophagaceae bacterium]
MNTHADLFIRLLRNPVKFRTFLFYKLPAAFFSGIRINGVDTTRCSVNVTYQWMTQNPFRSTYFASLAMAAEMSTGALAMMHVYKRDPPISMLITNMQASYFKKAISKTWFVCDEGQQISLAIKQAILTGESNSITVRSIGKNKDGEIIAEFAFTWSFKMKQV